MGIAVEDIGGHISVILTLSLVPLYKVLASYVLGGRWKMGVVRLLGIIPEWIIATAQYSINNYL
jgi:hypothetical protein